MAKFLGIDTSCYTTSAAVYDSTEGIVGESRIILSVKAGKRGLSQSEMVFQHVRNLPVILGQLEPWIDQINGIGVSVFPRRRADSYMPAFLVGKGNMGNTFLYDASFRGDTRCSFSGMGKGYYANCGFDSFCGHYRRTIH